MSFIGKLAYLSLFPGLAFAFLAGSAARGIYRGVAFSVTGSSPRGPVRSVPSVFRLLVSECVPAGGALHPVQWIAPAVRMFSLSLISCILFGFFKSDIVTVFALFLLSESCEVIACFLSDNPRVRQNGRGEAFQMLSWAVPLGIVVAAVSLRTGEISTAGIIEWQVANGVLPGTTSGGSPALAGSVLLLIAAFLSGLTLMRFRPFAGGIFSQPPGGIACDFSGPPLAATVMAESISLIIVPLFLVALFLAGPASNWYEVVFWALKVLGMFLVMCLADMVFPRFGSARSLAWSLGVGGALALAGLILVWVGVG